MNKINNLPIGSHNNLNALLPYVVARLCDGEWWYWGGWDDCYEAHQVACEIGGKVFLRSEILA